MDKLIKLTDLQLNPNNPRYITNEDFESLKRNIKTFSKMLKLRPMVIDNKGMLIGGNQRYLALKELGYKEIPENWVIKADDLTEEEIKQFIILDNIPFGKWDYDKLANEWEIENLQDWGLNLDDVTGNVTDIEEYSDLEKQSEALNGNEEIDIKISIPAMYKEKVIEWLANGEQKTGPGMGKGVLARCGLL